LGTERYDRQERKQCKDGLHPVLSPLVT
jgi:hypothetical protein